MQKWVIFKKSNVLNDKRTDPKVCWSVLNNFLNNIKILSAPPVLISGEANRNTVEKANIFNEFKLPLLLMNIDKRLKPFSIKKDDITSIIKSLNPTKAHGFGNISILVHKKEEKYLMKNYRPISLLPIFAKVCERLLFNSHFSHFDKNNLFAKCQSRFMPGDSCISQLLSIVHEIQSSFDYKLLTNVRERFLDIPEAWHQGLLFKLKSYGVKGNWDSWKTTLITENKEWYLMACAHPGKLFFLAYHKVLF